MIIQVFHRRRMDAKVDLEINLKKFFKKKFLQDEILVAITCNV
jgi:hypothetical protein